VTAKAPPIACTPRLRISTSKEGASAQKSEDGQAEHEKHTWRAAPDEVRHGHGDDGKHDVEARQHPRHLADGEAEAGEDVGQCQHHD
jgi:hypothetical protein